MDANKYDICLICFSNLNTDARSLNILRSLSKYGYKIACISIGNEPIELLNDLKIKQFYYNIAAPRIIFRWYKFINFIKKISNQVSANIYWAEDLYSLYAAYILNQNHLQHIVYDSREIFSALGTLSNNPIKQKIIAALEKHWVNNVDDIIVSGELDAQYLKSYFNLDINYHIVLNVPPYKEIIQSNILRERFNISDNKKIILYQGVVLPGRGLIPTLESLKYLNDFVLCVLGDGGFCNELILHAKKINVDDKLFLCGKVNYDELHTWTCSADIGISFIEPVSFSYQLALPNKMFEYCMAGLPVLASDLPAMHQILNQYPIGLLISPNSTPKNIAESLITLNRNKSTYSLECSRASKIFCYENQEIIINNIAHSILNKNI